MEEKVELLCRALWPYVQELVFQILNEKSDLAEANAELLAELVCFELTTRRMVKELNEKAGELEALRALIREDPELARKASTYVAKRLKWRIRKLVQLELSKHADSGANTNSSRKR